MSRIFISYKRVDKDKVFKIKDQIESALGEKCWIDLDGIESDAQFKNVIIKAINECEIVLFMYSKAHLQIVDFEKDWTVRELNFASKKNKRIVFINLDGSPLTDEFEFDYGTKQQIAAEISEAMSNLIRDLAKWLNIDLTTQSKEDELEVEEDDPDLQYYDENVVVALRYESGDRVNQNFETAFQLFEVAAKNKNPFAIFKIGEYYRNGWVGEIDYSAALKKYKKAVELGYTYPSFLIGMMYANGLGVASNAKKAMEWLLQSADDGNYEAMTQIGMLYLSGGKGLDENPEEAKNWFEKAADGKQGEAMLQLGLMYKQGNAVNQNDKKAVAWFRKSSKSGNSLGHINLGLCYERGEGVDVNLERAFNLYEKAYKQGEPWAAILMAEMYMAGRGVDKSVSRSIELLNEAVDCDDYEACDKLAICYAKGVGVKEDKEKAKDLFLHSIHLGYYSAIEHYNEYIGQESGVIMIIEDVFSITGRGTVITGVLTNDIAVGDRIAIYDKSGDVFESTVVGIEMFRKLLDIGTKGDNVGLLLQNIDSKYVVRGMVVAKL